MKIEKLRLQIDQLDKKLLQLLNERLRLAQSIGQIKMKSGQSVYAPDREERLMRHLSSINKGPISRSALQDVYREILSFSRALQRPLVVAYNGDPLSGAHLASRLRFGGSEKYHSFERFHDMEEAVEEGDADIGVFAEDLLVHPSTSKKVMECLGCCLHLCGEVLVPTSANEMKRYYMVSPVISESEFKNTALIWSTHTASQKPDPIVRMVARKMKLKVLSISKGEKGKGGGYRTCYRLGGSFTPVILSRLLDELSIQKLVFRLLGVYASE